MKKTFKKYFIPHEENDHKPYLLREKAVSITATIAVILLFASLIGSYVVKNSKFLAAIQSAFLVDLTNEDRQAEGAGKLVINDKLVLAAQLKANDMAEKSYFAHTSPEGLTPWHWFGEAKYDYIYAGENLAVNFNRSEDVERAWMNSPLHRANILNNRYKEIGIATAEGVYKGKNTTFVVQMFGSPVGGVSTQVATVVSSETQATTQTDLVVARDLNPEVEGESISKVEEISKEEKVVKASEKMAVVTETKVVAEVKDLKVEEDSAETFAETQNPNYEENVLSGETSEVKSETYTNWFERFLVNPGDAVNKAYVLLFVIILFSLILKIFVAIQKQHPKNIAYGVLLLILILIFMYINQEMFVTPVVAGFY